MTSTDGKVMVTVDITGMGSVSGEVTLGDLQSGKTGSTFSPIAEPVKTKPLPAGKGAK